jgi:hypothetical protein
VKLSTVSFPEQAENTASENIAMIKGDISSCKNFLNLKKTFC